MVRAFVAGAAVAVVMLGAAHAAAARGWSPETPVTPPGTNPFTLLRGVSCPSTSSCTAVGGFFTSANTHFLTLVEHWDGTGWTIQSSPNASGASDSELMAVSCPATTACAAVGFSEGPDSTANTPLAESWDGNSWTIQTVPLPVGASSGQLEGVSCSAATDCIAVGSYIDASGSENALAEHWDGSSWTLQTAAGPPDHTRLHGVSCSSGTACTAVGSTGNQLLAFAERWNGTAWTPQSTQSPAFNWTELNGASCPSATACTAVGYYTSGFSTVGTPLVERWDGTTWATQDTPKLQHAAALNGVACTSPDACTAVGTDYSAIASAWDGGRWRWQHVPQPPGSDSAELVGISCPAANECMAVGVWSVDLGYDQPLIERYS